MQAANNPGKLNSRSIVWHLYIIYNLSCLTSIDSSFMLHSLLFLFTLPIFFSMILAFMSSVTQCSTCRSIVSHVKNFSLAYIALERRDCMFVCLVFNTGLDGWQIPQIRWPLQILRFESWDQLQIQISLMLIELPSWHCSRYLKRLFQLQKFNLRQHN